MEYKPNIWTIAFALLIMGGAVIAGTQYFDNKTDALAALGGGVVITPGDCTILAVEETIITGNASGNIIATVQMAFNKPNFDRRIANKIVSSTNQTTIENETKQTCEDLWTSIQAEPQFQSVDTVVVQYEKNALVSILNRAYDVGKNSWSNISAEQVEP